MSCGPVSSRVFTVDETIQTIRCHCSSLETERIALAGALGRVLREAVRADTDQPPFDRSAVDGYAVRLEDQGRAFQIVDSIRAGDWKPRNLQSGEAVQIATGGALPASGLRVIMKENVRIEGDQIQITGCDTDHRIRSRGEDVKAGQVVLNPGIRLGPGGLALMAGVGHATPLVTRQPCVLHVATGDEIVPPDQTPAEGQIRDSNSTLVRAFFSQSGIPVTRIKTPEGRSEILSAINGGMDQLERIDLLLISGGASVGDHDFTGELLEELGYTLHIRRTSTRPGRPLIFGSNGNAAAFGLPGNPLAHFVCLNLYVRQALFKFGGATEAPDFREGFLANGFSGAESSRETLWPGRMQITGGRIQLVPLRWQSSGDLTSLGDANALLRVPPNQQPLSPGDRLQFLPV